MRPPAFDYVAPASADGVLECLERGGGDAKVIAGGQSLVPLLNFRLARPELLVDLRRVPDLDGLSVEADRVVIGATMTHRAVEMADELHEVLPIMRAAATHIGHPAIRNRGTIGGSLAHADAAAEWPIVAAALGARMHVLCPTGDRIVDARDFFVGYLTTALETNELLTAIEFPTSSAGAGWSFGEFARQPGAFALVIVVVLARLDASGRTEALSIAVGGVDAAPVVVDAELLGLLGAIPSSALVREAAEMVVRGLEPPEDVHASRQDRRDIARALVCRGLAEAFERAGATNVDGEGR